MIPHWLQAEHGPEQEQWGARRPRLRAASRWVLDGIPRDRALVAAERLRQSAVEELRGIQDPCGDAGRFFLEAVAPQPPRDEGTIERPDRSDVVADRVVTALAVGKRPHAPAREQARPHQVSHDRLRLRLVDDAAPQEMAVVRCERVHLLAFLVQRQGEKLVVLDPEVAVEPPLQGCGFLLQLPGELLVLPDETCEPRTAHLGVVRVALELACRTWKARQPAVAVGDRVPRVLPALILEPRLLVAPLVRDVAVPLEVGVLVDPVQRSASLVLELAHELRVAGPPLVLVEQHDVERRGVRIPVVGRMRPLLECRELAVTHLVQDPPGILVPEVVHPRSLPLTERAQGRRGQLGRERQRLQAREDAVPAEHRHEPRQTGRRQAAAAGDARRETQRREVDETAPIGRPERLPVALDAWRTGNPAVEIGSHARLATRPAAVVAALGAQLPTYDGPDHDIEARPPLVVRIDPHLERQAVLVDTSRNRRRDRGCAHERFALVPEHELPVADVRRICAFLSRASLTSNRSAESEPASMP